MINCVFEDLDDIKFKDKGLIMELKCCAYNIQATNIDHNLYVLDNTLAVSGIGCWESKEGNSAKWVILPLGGNKYQFLTCQDIRQNHNHRMSVEQVLELVIREPLTHPCQVFSLQQLKDGALNIIDHTGKYWTVTKQYKMCTYDYTGNSDQNFKLNPVDEVKEPELDPGKKWEPNQIEDVPRLEGFKSPPDESPHYLIGEMIYPAFFVEDPDYRSKARQIMENPYYILRREQYWNLIGYREYEGEISGSTEITTEVGVKKTTSRSMEETTGMRITAEFDIGCDPAVEAEGISISGWNKQNTSCAAELSSSLKVTHVSSEEESYHKEVKITVDFPKRRCAIASWLLCDQYTLLKQDPESKKRTLIGEWQVQRDKTQVDDCFPDK
jgi:hypothetical protein